MKDSVFCHNCNKLFIVKYEDFLGDKEETFTVIKCPYCNFNNSIYYTTSVNFHATKPSLEEYSIFKSNIEDEDYRGVKV